MSARCGRDARAPIKKRPARGALCCGRFVKNVPPAAEPPQGGRQPPLGGQRMPGARQRDWHERGGRPARRRAASRRAAAPLGGDGGERQSNALPAGVGSRFSGDVEESDRREAAGANVGGATRPPPSRLKGGGEKAKHRFARRSRKPPQRAATWRAQPPRGAASDRPAQPGWRARGGFLYNPLARRVGCAMAWAKRSGVSSIRVKRSRARVMPV